MPVIADVFGCPRHNRITPYVLEPRLCGKKDCLKCKNIGREPRTPDVIVDGKNLREEVLRFITLPVENEDDKDHSLPRSEAREKIESDGLSLEKLMRYLPDTRIDTEGKKYMVNGKKEDRSFAFDSSKVRATAKCN